MGEALRIYYTRYFPAGVILYVGALALIGSLLSGDEPTNWRPVLQAGSFLFALLAAIAGLIYNSKRIKPRAELGRNLSITVALDVDEQKYVKRVINGKEPAPPDPVRLSVARSVAIQTRKTNATNLLVVPMYSYCIGALQGTCSSSGPSSLASLRSLRFFPLASSGRQDGSLLPQHPRHRSHSRSQ